MMLLSGSTHAICVGLMLLGASDVAKQPLGTVVIPAGREAAVTALLSDVGFGTPLTGNLAFSNIQIEQQRIVISLRRLVAGREGDVVARLTLTPLATSQAGDAASESFAIRRQLVVDEPRIRELLDAAVVSIVKHDRGDIYETLPAGVRTGGDWPAYAPLLDLAGQAGPGDSEGTPAYFWLKLLLLLGGTTVGIYWLLRRARLSKGTAAATAGAPASDRDTLDEGEQPGHQGE